MSAPPGAGDGAGVRAFVRPHDVELTLEEGAPGTSVARGRVERMTRVGFTIRIELTLDDGQSLSVELTKDRVAELGISAGDRVFVNLREAKLFVQDYAILARRLGTPERGVMGRPARHGRGSERGATLGACLRSTCTM